MGFRKVDHTADVAVELEGASLSELLDACIRSMASMWLDGAGSLPGSSATVVWKRHAHSPEGVLVAWANEAIYSLEVNGFLALDSACQVAQRGDGWHVEGSVAGRSLGPESSFTPAVVLKAATWGDLHLHQSDGRWTCRLILDT